MCAQPRSRRTEELSKRLIRGFPEGNIRVFGRVALRLFCTSLGFLPRGYLLNPQFPVKATIRLDAAVARLITKFSAERWDRSIVTASRPRWEEAGNGGMRSHSWGTARQPVSGFIIDRDRIHHHQCSRCEGAQRACPGCAAALWTSPDGITLQLRLSVTG